MAVENTPRSGGDAMDKERKPVVRRPVVLRKLNAENLSVIERGLLGDLPERFKPSYKPVPVRGRPTDLLVAKPSGFLSSCLPVVPDSPVSEKFTSSDDESITPTLKKSFSFRDKFSKRISFLNKKEKHQKRQWTTIVEDEKNSDLNGSVETEEFRGDDKKDHDYKSSKRFWFFRNKEVEKKMSARPAYKRSKSFEFLPRAIEEEEEEEENVKQSKLKTSASYVFGSTDTIVDSWSSNESLEYISNVYYDKDDAIYLKSFKEISPESSKNSSSTISAASGLAANIFNTQSVQNLLEEFDKAVDLFSEVYLSDSEPYTKNKIVPVEEKRKSCSFSTLPSPKVMHVAKVKEISEDFKLELSRVLSEKRASAPVKSARRGSVTDWFVLEDHAGADKYRRAQRKPLNRVRRMSSTKYMLADAVETDQLVQVTFRTGQELSL